jgi:hypothetical protein
MRILRSFDGIDRRFPGFTRISFRIIRPDQVLPMCPVLIVVPVEALARQIGCEATAFFGRLLRRK